MIASMKDAVKGTGGSPTHGGPDPRTLAGLHPKLLNPKFLKGLYIWGLDRGYMEIMEKENGNYYSILGLGFRDIGYWKRK